MARSSVVSELGFIVSFVWVRAMYCFQNQSCQPFLELPTHPVLSAGSRSVFYHTYTGVSLTATGVIFLVTCDTTYRTGLRDNNYRLRNFQRAVSTGHSHFTLNETSKFRPQIATIENGRLFSNSKPNIYVWNLKLQDYREEHKSYLQGVYQLVT